MSVIQVTTAYYPESDGRPMGETDEHRDAMVRHIELLKHHFRGQRVYVSGNLLVYYEQGNPKKFIVPDAFVAKGIKSHTRRVYKTWVEGKAPDVAIETTSKKTKKKDTTTKPEIYARIGVKEYFLFDPTREYLDPILQGYRLLDNGEYARIKPDSVGALMSEQLQLRLEILDAELELFKLDGERLLTAEERSAREFELRQAADARTVLANAETAREAEARQAAEALAAREGAARKEEAAARKAAEAELARLREELRLKSK